MKGEIETDGPPEVEEYAVEMYNALHRLSELQPRTLAMKGSRFRV